MVIFPVPTETISEKVITRLVLILTSIALSAGERDWMVGDVLSTAIVVKFHVVLSAIPANGLSDPSLRAQAASWI